MDANALLEELKRDGRYDTLVGVYRELESKGVSESTRTALVAAEAQFLRSRALEAQHVNDLYSHVQNAAGTSA